MNAGLVFYLLVFAYFAVVGSVEIWNGETALGLRGLCLALAWFLVILYHSSMQRYQSTLMKIEDSVNELEKLHALLLEGYKQKTLETVVNDEKHD